MNDCFHSVDKRHSKYKEQEGVQIYAKCLKEIKVMVQEVKNIMEKLNEMKAQGWDGIPS